MNSISQAQTALQKLLDIIVRLRAPDGCPWDRKQTKMTLKPYLLEEAYEVLDAIDLDDPGELCEELGDLLLQIVLLARLHEEAGAFDFAKVCTSINDKLIRRHPHVFGEQKRHLSETELEHQWQQIKARENQSKTRRVQSRKPALPSLVLAEKACSSSQEIEADQLKQRLNVYLEACKGNSSEGCEEALGDLLFALVGSGKGQGLRAETALRRRVLGEPNSSRTEKS